MSNKTSERDDDADIDDLDDIVDQFDNSKDNKSATNTSAPSSSIATGDITAAAEHTSAEGQHISDELAEQLAADMENLVRQFTAAEGAGAGSSEDDRKRQEAFEKMLIEGMNGLDLGGAQDDVLDSQGGTQNVTEDPFQKSIRQAMQKLNDTSASLKDSASTEPHDDPLKELLAQLAASPDGTADGAGDEALQGLLESMMRQLMCKEVLYEPLKELHEKFPSYLADHNDALTAEDKERYSGQIDRVSKIVEIFENPSYTDDNAELSARVVTLMNEMQSFGSPPSEIMGPLPPGFDFGSDGSPNIPDNCTIS